MYFKEDVNCFANLYQTKIKPNHNSLWYTCTVILVAPYDIKPKTYVKRQGTLLLKVLTKVLPSLAKQVKLGAVLQFTEIRQEADERFHILFFKSTVYTRVQVERVYKSNPIFEAKNTTFVEKV